MTDTEKIYGLSLFWKQASYNFAFFDQVPKLNWDSTYQAFIPKVLATESTFEYYRTLKRFCALLNDGHTNVYFPSELDVSAYIDFPAIQLEDVRHRAIVTNVGVKLTEKIPIGSEILRVEGETVKNYLQSKVFPYISVGTKHIQWDWGIMGSLSQGFGLLAGSPGSKLHLTLRTPEGETREVVVRRNRYHREVMWTRSQNNENVPLFEMRWVTPKIAYVALNTFANKAIVADFKKALPELRKAEGLIIDVRRNGGGNSGYAARIAAYLSADTLVSSAWRTPINIAALKAWSKFGSESPYDEKWSYKRWKFVARRLGSWVKVEPYRKGMAWLIFGGDPKPPATDQPLMMPTVVLIGHWTASSAENFLVYLDQVNHITFVGRPTFGSTGQPLFFTLPGGGIARVVTKRDTYPNGKDFVDVGIQPDVLVKKTIKGVLTDKDPILQRGIQILKYRINHQ